MTPSHPSFPSFSAPSQFFSHFYPSFPPPPPGIFNRLAWYSSIFYLCSKTTPPPPPSWFPFICKLHANFSLVFSRIIPSHKIQNLHAPPPLRYLVFSKQQGFPAIIWFGKPEAEFSKFVSIAKFHKPFQVNRGRLSFVAVSPLVDKIGHFSG